MRIGRWLLPAAVLAACTGAEIGQAVEDGLKTPAERCAEARHIYASLDHTARNAALLMAACAEEIAR